MAADLNSIFTSQKLFGFLGVNVIEDEAFTLDVATQLKEITDRLGLPYVFKASCDKANRSSIHSFRGPGMKEGLKVLSNIKDKLNVPVISDIHEPAQAEEAAEVLDVIQIPAFLCRQTDLITAAAKAAEKHQRVLHIKKAQFLAPWDCKNILKKVDEATDKTPLTLLCERGSSFGYNRLICDPLSIPELKKFKVPVTIDATHGAQLPTRPDAPSRQEEVKYLAYMGVATGADGVFLEFHPEPSKALCDSVTCLPLSEAESVLKRCQAFYMAAHS